MRALVLAGAACGLLITSWNDGGPEFPIVALVVMALGPQRFALAKISQRGLVEERSRSKAAQERVARDMGC